MAITVDILLADGALRTGARLIAPTAAPHYELDRRLRRDRLPALSLRRGRKRGRKIKQSRL